MIAESDPRVYRFILVEARSERIRAVYFWPRAKKAPLSISTIYENSALLSRGLERCSLQRRKKRSWKEFGEDVFRNSSSRMSRRVVLAMDSLPSKGKYLGRGKVNSGARFIIVCLAGTKATLSPKSGDAKRIFRGARIRGSGSKNYITKDGSEIFESTNDRNKPVSPNLPTNYGYR